MSFQWDYSFLFTKKTNRPKTAINAPVSKISVATETDVLTRKWLLIHMKSFIHGNTAFFGSISAIVAVFCFSINDVAIKFLSGDYALHLIILVRSIVGLIVLFLIIVPFSGGLQSLHTLIE